MDLIDITKAPVHAQATLEHLFNRRYKVTVKGQPPHEFTKIYAIDADSDHEAAFEGIRRFEREMSRPLILLDS